MACIDAHAHLRADPEGAAKFVALMDRLDVEAAFVVFGGLVPPAVLARQISYGGGTDASADNAALLRHAAAHPGRLIPYYFANPLQGSAEYERDGHAYAGLKLGPAVHGVPLSDHRTGGLIERAARFGHAVYLHCLARPGFDLPAFVTLAKTHGSVRFVLGHGGIGQADFDALERIAPLDNVALETSGAFTGLIAAAFRMLGKDRVLFGSEYPLQDPRAELAKLDCLALTAEERAAYLRLNSLKWMSPHAP